jgi:hypothetical protein
MNLLRYLAIVNPKVCGFPEAWFGVSKRLQLSSSLGMEDAPQFTLATISGYK